MILENFEKQPNSDRTYHFVYKVLVFVSMDYGYFNPELWALSGRLITKISVRGAH